MYTLIIIVHVIACFILIAVILLQAGKGSGLSELLGGGGTAQTIFGIRTPKFLVRATTAAAILFLLTCISLSVFSSKKVKSIMSGVKETGVVEQTQPKSAPLKTPEEVAKENLPTSEQGPQESE